MSTGLDTFDTSLQKTNQYFKNIELRLNWDGRRDQTYLAVRACIHQLRNHLPLHEAIAFSAQMPLFLKGIYFDSWNSKRNPLKENREEFIAGISKEFQYSVPDILEVIKTVYDETFYLMDEGERQKIMNLVPKDIAELLC